MARPRLRLGRILVVFVLFVLMCLLLELNRFLPGGWPGGGGDGGARRAGLVNVDDVPGTSEADRPTPARMTEPGDRPPVELPRDGVVIEVRSLAGAFADTWRFGVGDGGPEDVVPKALNGRHASRDRRLVQDGFRVRTTGGLVRVRPALSGAERGHWIVVAPDVLPPIGRQRTRFEVRVDGAWGTRRQARIESADGAVEEVPIPADGTVILEQRREPFRLTTLIDGIEGSTRWIGPRSPASLVVPAPRAPDPDPERRRVVLLPPGEQGFLARFVTTPVGAGAAEPAFGYALPEDDGGGGRVLRVPVGVPVDVLVDDPAQRPYSVRLKAGATTQQIRPEAPEGIRVPIRVLDEGGAPVIGAFVVAGVAAEPFLTLRHATTDATGSAELRGVPLGPLGVFVAAPDRGLATRRVLLEVRDEGGHEVRLGPGATLALVVADPQGLPVPGATIDIEPADGDAPVPSAPQPTAGPLPDVSPTMRAALGWNDAETDERGTWRAAGVARGRYRLRIRAPGYARAVLEDVQPGPRRTWFVTLVPQP